MKSPNPPAPFPRREGGGRRNGFLAGLLFPYPPSLRGKGAGGLGLLLLLVLLAPARAADTVNREAAYKAALPLYQYDAKKPLAVKIDGRQTLSNAVLTRFSYRTTSGERVPALLYLPLTASKAKPVPTLIMLHGLGGNKEQMALLAGVAVSQGYGALAIDEWGQGARQKKTTAAGQMTAAQTQQNLIVGVRQTALDVRRAIDFLQTVPGVDKKRIGLLGVSLGAIIGTVTAGVDTRIKATVLVAGGGGWGTILKSLAARPDSQPVGGHSINASPGVDWNLVGALLAAQDPLTFAAHIAPRPVLMQSGRQDTVIVPAATKALYDAARKPAHSRVHIDWYDAGHVPPPNLILPVIQAWLAKNL